MGEQIVAGRLSPHVTARALSVQQKGAFCHFPKLLTSHSFIADLQMPALCLQADVRHNFLMRSFTHVTKWSSLVPLYFGNGVFLLIQICLISSNIGTVF